MDRILLILHARDRAACMQALESARTAAASPDALSIGLSLEEELGRNDRAALQKLGRCLCAAPSAEKWEDMPQMWHGEGYVLMGHPAMRFERGWDRKLLRILRQCQRDTSYPVILTGYLPRTMDVVDAVSPVAAAGFDAAGRLCLHRGVPLRYAASPAKGAFVHPDFAFGRAEIFQRMAQPNSPRCLTAFLNRYEIYTLHKPVIRVQWDDPVPPVCLDVGAEGAERFAGMFGLDLGRQRASLMAREGIFTRDASFEMQVPLAVRIQEKLRQTGSRGSKLAPVCVTACLRAPDSPEMDMALVRLKRLSSIRRLPLLCFAEPEWTQRVHRSHSGVVEYSQRYGLPVAQRLRQADMSRYARLSKAFMLASCREQLAGKTHYIWMDVDYLTYPVYENTALDWETVCRERICVASVDGRLDLSMISVPEGWVETLCKEIAAHVEHAARGTGRLPDENEVWQAMAEEHPDWFQLIELPGQRELFSLTMPSRAEEWLAQL